MYETPFFLQLTATDNVLATFAPLAVKSVLQLLSLPKSVPSVCLRRRSVKILRKLRETGYVNEKEAENIDLMIV